MSYNACLSSLKIEICGVKLLELPSRHFQYAPMLVSHDQAPFK